MDSPRIPVIIPVYKDWVRLQSCLNALAGQSYDSDKYEIIVINNDISSSVPETLKYPANMSIHDEMNPSSYVSRNRGVLLAQGDILAFTDSDCNPDKDWLSNGLKTLNEGFDLVGGRINIFKAKDSDSDWAYKFEKLFSFDQKSNVLLKKSSVTANLIVKKSVISSVGLFRQDLVSSGDALWTSTVTANGFTIGYGNNRMTYYSIIYVTNRLL